MGTLKKYAIRIGLGLLLLCVFLGHAARLYQIPIVTQLDFILYDYRLKLTMPRGVDESIVILDIDEKSLKEEGRWPWSRHRLAQMVDKLFDQYGAAVVGFDVVFAEKDESSGLRVLRDIGNRQLKDNAAFQTSLEKISPQLEYDQLFAGAIKNRAVVLGYYFSNDPAAPLEIGVLPKPVLPAGTASQLKGSATTFERAYGYGSNLPELMAAAAGAGHFDALPDFDGVVRRVPMLIEYNGAHYESLSLAMVRALFGFPKVELGVVDAGGGGGSAGSAGRSGGGGYTGLEWLNLSADGFNLKIPVDQNVSTLVPYRGPQGSFRYVSATDVLRDRIKPEELKGKIVLVGATAKGLFDLRSTPVAEVYPGVEVHANLISGMINQTIKLKPPYVLAADVVLVLLTGLVLIFLLPMLSPLYATLATLAVTLVVVAVNLTTWYANLVLPMAGSLLLIASLFALNMSYGYFVETRSKQQINKLFGRYVSPELVEEMGQHPEQVSMEGESREMSVLFSDVRGFTTISEGLEPHELSRLMNEFLSPLTHVIYNHRGTVDKYMGDCIMAFWGAPLKDPDHARNALLAGMAMQARLAELQPHFKAQGWPEIHIGVGVNSGRMSVGNMGSEIRVAYTVMGDAVNLASRLEGITKQYGVGMIVGEATRDAVKDFVFRELDKVRVKGKDEPVAIFEPIGAAGSVSKTVMEELKLFQQALRLYRAQDWDQAELQLYNLQKMSPATKLYAIYAERVAKLRMLSPGEGWDGVWVFETK